MIMEVISFLCVRDCPDMARQCQVNYTPGSDLEGQGTKAVRPGCQAFSRTSPPLSFLISHVGAVALYCLL